MDLDTLEAGVLEGWGADCIIRITCPARYTRMLSGCRIQHPSPARAMLIKGNAIG